MTVGNFINDLQDGQSRGAYASDLNKIRSGILNDPQAYKAVTGVHPRGFFEGDIPHPSQQSIVNQPSSLAPSPQTQITDPYSQQSVSKQQHIIGGMASNPMLRIFPLMLSLAGNTVEISGSAGLSEGINPYVQQDYSFMVRSMVGQSYAVSLGIPNPEGYLPDGQVTNTYAVGVAVSCATINPISVTPAQNLYNEFYQVDSMAQTLLEIDRIKILMEIILMSRIVLYNYKLRDRVAGSMIELTNAGAIYSDEVIGAINCPILVNKTAGISYYNTVGDAVTAGALGTADATMDYTAYQGGFMVLQGQAIGTGIQYSVAQIGDEVTVILSTSAYQQLQADPKFLWSNTGQAPAMKGLGTVMPSVSTDGQVIARVNNNSSDPYFIRVDGQYFGDKTNLLMVLPDWLFQMCGYTDNVKGTELVIMGSFSAVFGIGAINHLGTNGSGNYVYPMAVSDTNAVVQYYTIHSTPTSKIIVHRPQNENRRVGQGSSDVFGLTGFMSVRITNSGVVFIEIKTASTAKYSSTAPFTLNVKQSNVVTAIPGGLSSNEEVNNVIPYDAYANGYNKTYEEKNFMSSYAKMFEKSAGNYRRYIPQTKKDIEVHENIERHNNDKFESVMEAVQNRISIMESTQKTSDEIRKELEISQDKRMKELQVEQDKRMAEMVKKVAQQMRSEIESEMREKAKNHKGSHKTPEIPENE